MRIRNCNNQTSAAAVEQHQPFAGLGFVMDSVKVAALGMELIPEGRCECSGAGLIIPNLVQQPSGYSLLVTLGREIRGR